MASFPGARVVVLLCFLVHLVFSVDWIAIQALTVSIIFFFFASTRHHIVVLSIAWNIG